MTDRSSVPPWATPRRTLLAVAAFLVSLAALAAADMWLESITGEPVGSPMSADATKPDLWFGYDTEEVTTLFASYGPDGRRAYAVGLVIDTVYPLALAAAAILLWARAFGGAHRWGRIPAAVFAVLDVIENFLFGVMLATHPSVPSGLVAVASPITQVKLASFWPAIVSMAVSSGVLAWRRVTKGRVAA
ncbi:MAG TPA: hypothetical protein VLB67_13255 [Acidimicrobiia bacterium]|nr:hypothetical protein [Acidimicrobiia bacterium]